jgi:hypothetical protein
MTQGSHALFVRRHDSDSLQPVDLKDTFNIKENII